MVQKRHKKRTASESSSDDGVPFTSRPVGVKELLNSAKVCTYAY